MPLASTRHTRTSTRCRSLATKRSSVVAPGNNTLWAVSVGLRAELAEMKVDLIKWMVGTGLGIAAVTATLAGIPATFVRCVYV